MDLGGNGRWDDGLCDLLGVPMDLLPEITDNTTTVGTTDPALFGGAIPISGLAGDQEAATAGPACLSPGETKATFGTGALILSASGTTRPTAADRLRAPGMAIGRAND